MSALRFGYLLGTQEASGAAGRELVSLVELGARAEALGFDAVWVPDSPFQYGVPDPLVVLSALAARTERVTLATGVLLAGLRQPAMLTQQLASLDALSGGRLRVGLGSGFPSPDSERQFAAAGADFGSRVARLEETVKLMRELWAAGGRPVTYAGSHVRVDGLTLSPAPVRPGGPELWLAGAGPRAQRRVGRLADGWLPYLNTAGAYADGLRRVREAADAAGRTRSPTAGLYLTVALDRSEDVARRRLRSTLQRWYRRRFEVISALQATYAGTPAGLAEHLDAYEQAGLEHAVLRVADEPRRGLEAAAEAIRQIAVAA